MLIKYVKFFVQCSVIYGAFQENIETIQSRYFSLMNCHRFLKKKNTKEQIEMCFQAYVKIGRQCLIKSYKLVAKPLSCLWE